MTSLANAHLSSSLNEYKRIVDQFSTELDDDVVIKRHLDDLYDKLLEQNLLTIIEPYEVVEVSHVAKLIELPAETVEKKY